MEYLEPVAAPSHPGGAAKYHGAVATGYDAKRINDPKWTVEQNLIEDWLREFPAGTEILDCPVGTGRFLKAYVANGQNFVGVDRQPDMLVQAACKILPEAKVREWMDACTQHNAVLPFRIEGKGLLTVGDVCQTGLRDKIVDVSLCIRLTRWLIEERGPEGIVQMVRELQRVSRQAIILTARVANHKWAVSRELIEQGLDGWKIDRDQAGYVTDYRILRAVPA
jgi:SAM-dependent methyltransferase